MSMRRTSVHPLTGGVITAVCGRTAMEAIMTSPSRVPAGVGSVRTRTPEAALAEDALRNVMSGMTVSVVEPWMLLPGSVAVIVVTPTETLVARPLLPGALLIVAMPASESPT